MKKRGKYSLGREKEVNRKALRAFKRLLTDFSNLISYSIFPVHSLCCFALHVSSSIEYGPFCLQFCLLFLKSGETSQRAASSLCVGVPAFKAFCKI